MKKEIIKNKSIKKFFISFLLVIALVVQFAFLSYLFKAITPSTDKKKENVVMSYTSTGNFDYKVYLKENDFIKSEYLDAGEAYILDLIDHIKLTSFYNFKSTSKTNVTGTNKLVAKLKVYYKESSDKNNNPEVMTKENVIEEKIMNFDDNNYNAIGSYDIYLKDYIQKVSDFREQVKIAVDGYLEISQINDFSGTVGGVTYKNKYTNTIKIPLSDSVVKIDSAKGTPKTEEVYEGDLVKTNKTVMSYILIANIVTFIIICLLLKKLFGFTNKTLYDRTLSKILKSYDDIIVNTTTMIDKEKYKVVKIEEFKEILNLSRELLLPIMNYEVEKGVETCFYIVKDDILYTYKIHNDELEEQKKKKTK